MTYQHSSPYRLSDYRSSDSKDRQVVARAVASMLNSLLFDPRLCSLPNHEVVRLLHMELGSRGMLPEREVRRQDMYPPRSKVEGQCFMALAPDTPCTNQGMYSCIMCGSLACAECLCQEETCYECYLDSK